MAQLCLLLVALVVGLSAFMRHRAAGLGCDAGPACYGQNQRAPQAGQAPAADAEGVAAARVAHRVVATLALILAITLVLGSFATRPVLPREGALAAGVLALALGLALLGVFTPGSRQPAVAMGNLLGGFVMLALCARLVDATHAQRPATSVARRGLLMRVLLMLALLMLLAQIALGALVSTSFAGLSCRTLGECVDLARASGWDAQVLSPWRVAAFEPAAVLPNPAGALTQLMHRLGSVMAAMALLAVGLLAWRSGRRRAAVLLLVLLSLQVALGLTIAAGALPLPLVLCHNLNAALMLALLARLA